MPPFQNTGMVSANLNCLETAQPVRVDQTCVMFCEYGYNPIPSSVSQWEFECNMRPLIIGFM
jgi:hypothetical protein